MSAADSKARYSLAFQIIFDAKTSEYKLVADSDANGQPRSWATIAPGHALYATIAALANTSVELIESRDRADASRAVATRAHLKSIPTKGADK